VLAPELAAMAGVRVGEGTKRGGGGDDFKKTRAQRWTLQSVGIRLESGHSGLGKRDRAHGPDEGPKRAFRSKKKKKKLRGGGAGSGLTRLGRKKVQRAKSKRRRPEEQFDQGNQENGNKETCNVMGPSDVKPAGHGVGRGSKKPAPQRETSGLLTQGSRCGETAPPWRHLPTWGACRDPPAGGEKTNNARGGAGKKGLPVRRVSQAPAALKTILWGDVTS